MTLILSIIVLYQIINMIIINRMPYYNIKYDKYNSTVSSLLLLLIPVYYMVILQYYNYFYSSISSVHVKIYSIPLITYLSDILVYSTYDFA